MSFSKFTDPTKTLLAVASINTVTGGYGTGTVLANPDGTIVSIQPDGSVQSRPPGADGGYERCTVSGNLATWQPVTGVFYTYAYVLVAALL